VYQYDLELIHDSVKKTHASFVHLLNLLGVEKFFMYLYSIYVEKDPGTSPFSPLEISKERTHLLPPNAFSNMSLGRILSGMYSIHANMEVKKE